MNTKTTKTTATNTTATNTTAPAVKSVAKTTAPAVKLVAKTTAPAVKPAVKSAVKLVAKTTTPAVKAEAPKAEKARKARISKVDSAWTTLANSILELSAKDSKSSVGQFIIKFFKENQEKTDVTGELLAKAFVTSFKTKTGIKPDEKWARRNVKLFVDKGVIMCKIETEQKSK